MSINAGKNSAHVIVCGNEKGGSGKTTTIVHLSVAIMNAGYRVATIDLDSRQKSFTRYLNNRREWSKRNSLKLPLPDHFVINHSKANYYIDRDREEVEEFSDVIASVEKTHDFILIDTPGHDGNLMRIAHSMADTLVTPLNDSFIDFDVLGHVSADTGEILKLSHYAHTVREARRYRNRADNGILDWIVVRNRLTQLHSRNNSAMLNSLQQLSMELGCRLAEGISERMVFRELFPTGLTALDDIEKIAPNGKTPSSIVSARQEVRSLISSLGLPIDEVGKKRANARRQWLEKAYKPIDSAGILAE